jgi:hypothetical protein
METVASAAGELEGGDPGDVSSASPKVLFALVAGFVILAIALVVTFSHSPPSLAWSNYAPLRGSILTTESGGGSACQGPLPLPADVSAVRISLYDSQGPRVAVRVLAGNRVLTSGVRGAGWIGESPTVPLAPVRRSVAGARLCFALGQPAGIVALQGSAASGPEALSFAGAKGPRVRMRVEYLKPGTSSWWSQATPVARRMGLGRWPSGTWLALLVVALLATIAAGVAWLTARELR